MSDVSTYASLGSIADQVWDSYGANGIVADADMMLERFLEWVDEQGVEPWAHQEDALMNIAVGDHVILGTPTGSGKSLVALGMHFMALCQDKTSFYTAPIKALVSEKFFQLVDYFGKEYVGMITGDGSINATAPIICCTAEILANLALREGDQADACYVAMDEFHFYGDKSRGWAWQVPLITLPQTQFLLMSATLGDVSRIAADLEAHTGRPVDVIENALRPVPLSFEYVETSLEGTVELTLRKAGGPVYVVHFSQDAALNSASALASYGIATKEQREAVKEASKGTSFNTPFGKTLKRLLGCGIGLHHAGMLPRYRLLVEKLAQQGLLPVICGTDTLGVGINVPIHTVLLTALSKYDGSKSRRLNAREFHQIAGRAGRSGFDTEGLVLVQAPDYEIENAKLKAQAGDDKKKLRKLKLKKAPEGFVGWNKQNFEQIVVARPEPLKPRMRMTHSTVISSVEQGGDVRLRMMKLIDDSAQTDEEKAALRIRFEEMLQTLLHAGMVNCQAAEDGSDNYSVAIEMPDNFALDQPLSPFLVAALELLDPENPSYSLDLVSMVEATVENPGAVLKAQLRREKSKAIAKMKMDGVDYEERMDRLDEVTYPKPLKDLLNSAFALYCESMPWASDHRLEPKSILREMMETGATFKGYVTALGISRSEGALLRYLSDVYHVLDRTIPEAKMDERLKDTVSWLSLVIRGTDSSLLDEWENAGSIDDAAPVPENVVVKDRRGMTVLVRNALFNRVKLAAKQDYEALGECDAEWGQTAFKWKQSMDGFFEEHEEVIIDAEARSGKYFSIDESLEASEHTWSVQQVFLDSDEAYDFRMEAILDLDATQETGDAVFKKLRVGFAWDLSE